MIFSHVHFHEVQELVNQLVHELDRIRIHSDQPTPESVRNILTSTVKNLIAIDSKISAEHDELAVKNHDLHAIIETLEERVNMLESQLEALETP